MEQNSPTQQARGIGKKMKKPIIIAIDGTAGSGKGTIAKKLAAHFNFPHLDTGKLYRLTAHAVLSNNDDIHDEKTASRAAKNINIGNLSNNELTENHIANGAGIVAKMPTVRRELIAYQRNFPNNKSGVIIDGRDIGTVIFPLANIKLFIDADLDVRALRRYKELKKMSSCNLNNSHKSSVKNCQTEPNFATIKADMCARDNSDKARKISPLRPASDAIFIDTSNISYDDLLSEVLKKIPDIKI